MVGGDRRLTEVVEAGARPGPQPEILVHLREAAPEPRPPVAWLEPDRLGVFLPILLGAGVLASAAAWVVEALPGKPPGRHWSAAWPPGWRSSPCPPAVSSGPSRRGRSGAPAGPRRGRSGSVS